MKFAVEGMSEAMHYELATVGIKVKVVEPGMIATDFSGRSFDFANDPAMEEYQPVVGTFMASMASDATEQSAPGLVAEVVWNAVTDGSGRLRYRAGADAEALLTHRRNADDETFMAGIRQQFGL